MSDRYAHVQAAIDSLSEYDQKIALCRLSARFNNGDAHFDHHHPDGFSRICVACARRGDGNGGVAISRLLAGLGVEA